MSTPLIVNFLGGPGIGKSTLSHDCYSELKSQDKRVYLVPDFPALHVFKGDEYSIHDYLSLGAETNRGIELALRAKHDLVLVENPMIMGMLYMDSDPTTVSYRESFRPLVEQINRDRPALNLVLKRSESYDYDEGSRHMNLEQAKAEDARLLEYVQKSGMPFLEYSVVGLQHDLAAQQICEVIMHAYDQLQKGIQPGQESNPATGQEPARRRVRPG